MSIIIKDSEKFYESLTRTTNSVIEIAGRKRNQYACLMTNTFTAALNIEQ